jgi:hypothetical protein
MLLQLPKGLLLHRLLAAVVVAAWEAPVPVEVAEKRSGSFDSEVLGAVGGSKKRYRHPSIVAVVVVVGLLATLVARQHYWCLAVALLASSDVEQRLVMPPVGRYEQDWKLRGSFRSVLVALYLRPMKRESDPREVAVVGQLVAVSVVVEWHSDYLAAAAAAVVVVVAFGSVDQLAVADFVKLERFVIAETSFSSSASLDVGRLPSFAYFQAVLALSPTASVNL